MPSLLSQFQKDYYPRSTRCWERSQIISSYNVTNLYLSNIRDCSHLLEMSTKNPTPCKELFTGWPHYIGFKNSYIHGIGGIIMGKGKACIPTVFRLAWPDDIKWLFHKGNITNSDLGIEGFLILWVVMEEVCPKLQAAHAALFSDNSPTIGWVKRLSVRG